MTGFEGFLEPVFNTEGFLELVFNIEGFLELVFNIEVIEGENWPMVISNLKPLFTELY